MEDTHSQPPSSSQYHPPLHSQYSSNSSSSIHSCDAGRTRVRPVASDVSTKAAIRSQHPGRVWTHPSQKRWRDVTTPKRPLVRPLVLDATASPSSLHHLHWLDHPSASSSSSSFPEDHASRSMSRPSQSTKQAPQQWELRDHLSSPPTPRILCRKSGFLNKLGVNIPIYKRRFFSLHPATLMLQYYLSPHDTEPRGSYNLYNARVEHNFTDDDTADDDDTVHRWAIIWETEDSSAAPQRVELEARSKSEALQWIRIIESEQLSPSAQRHLQQAQDTICDYQRQVLALQKEIATYKYMEQERDDAMADANQYQAQLGHLDEAIRLLTQQIRRRNISMTDDTTVSPSAESSPATTNTVEKVNSNSSDKQQDEESGKPREVDSLSPESKDADNEMVESQGASSSEGLVDIVFDIRQVPGMHFSALHNAVEQLHENIRLSSQEAIAAVEDVTAANEQVAIMEQRMAKIEKHLCKIWEENCSLRKSSKQMKREKRVLVREIKSLRETISSKEVASNRIPSKGEEPLRSFTDEFLDASDEEKLINELEEHVLSSIRLHEQFLSSVRLNDAPSNVIPDEFLSSSTDSELLLKHALEPQEPKGKAQVPPTIHPSVPLFEQNTLPTVMASLLDESESDTTSNHSSDDEAFDNNTTTPIANTTDRKAKKARASLFFETPAMPSAEVDVSMDESELPNPLLHLDDDEDHGHHTSSHHLNLGTASSQSESAKSLNSHDNKATCQLSCPLKDVIVTSATTSAPIPTSSTTDDELQVYHITFYSRKIGIQFQRAPPAPVKAKGLLTEAMTDDLTLKPKTTLSDAQICVGATAAELRRIAAISNRAKASPTSSTSPKMEECALAVPVDAVLVCGFIGFDESNTTNCARPKLGARLVAFDGVSIEVGKWTFAAVRKAIQSCGRPLTLSFRNDFLTIEQRMILTKAVLDSDQAASAPDAKRLVNDPPRTKKGSDTLTKRSKVDLSPIPGFCERDGPTRTMTDDLSESVDDGSDHLNSFPQSFSGNRSVSSLAQYRSFYETRSLGSSSVGRNDKVRSFSEVGSATTTATNSSVLSAIGPLMSSLLLRPQGKAASFTPEFLRRAPEFVEDTPQHQDFQSELL